MRTVNKKKDICIVVVVLNATTAAAAAVRGGMGGESIEHGCYVMMWARVVMQAMTILYICSVLKAPAKWGEGYVD